MTTLTLELSPIVYQRLSDLASLAEKTPEAVAQEVLASTFIGPETEDEKERGEDPKNTQSGWFVECVRPRII